VEFDYRRFLHANTKIMDMLETAKRSSDMMIDHLPVLFAVVNDKSEILRANHKLAEIVGCPLEELRGRKLVDLFEEADRESFLERVRRASPDDINVNFMCTMRLRTGSGSQGERQYAWKIWLYSDAAACRLIGILGDDGVVTTS